MSYFGALIIYLSVLESLDNFLWGVKVFRVMRWEVVHRFIYSTNIYRQAWCLVLGW